MTKEKIAQINKELSLLKKDWDKWRDGFNKMVEDLKEVVKKSKYK